ncbi:MAG TPA: ribonuclease HI family protein [Acidobacteriota bacterium]|nr:ribonuclease HI family protein [Acidobacteriota bacterium]
MFVAHIDGASRGNPGHAAYGVRVCDATGVEVATLGEYLGRQTNNYAEYQGLIAALRWASDNGVEAFTVRSDSQLLVRQMQGRYKVKSTTLRPLWQQASELAATLRTFRLEHVRRESNVEADSLANDVLDAQSAR